MSYRLHIGAIEETGGYDCVIESADTCRERLDEFLSRSGPWKIRIGDVKLFREIEPILREQFNENVGQYPDDIWSFYHGDQSIVHPTQKELDEWLLKNENSKPATK